MPDDRKYSVILRQVLKKFGGFTAVDYISMNVERAEIFGFLGPNGAGKTTTIKMLCGLIKPTSGDCIVDGIDILKHPDDVKKITGYMSQKFSLYEDLKISENIDFYGGIYGVKNNLLKMRKRWILDMAGLTGKENRLTKTLSLGWKQRLALGCAVVHNPSILFLDEPTSGVDPVTRRNFWKLIYELSDSGVTVFVTTHYMQEAEYCHKLALIDRGSIKAIGSPDELKKMISPEPMIEIRCCDPNSVLEELKKTGFILEGLIHKNILKLVLKEKVDKSKIESLLKSRNYSFSLVKTIVPSLEDVFIRVTDS
ncbi:ABC transporter ATP-binding protein [candidate division WOR-3 bacterium]|nr:ABC transporter ATP-binding protein [candidate division WOR-3 bacterium]